MRSAAAADFNVRDCGAKGDGVYPASRVRPLTRKKEIV